MTHFEYMEQQGQLSIFDLEDQYEEISLPQMLISLLIRRLSLKLIRYGILCGDKKMNRLFKGGLKNVFL